MSLVTRLAALLPRPLSNRLAGAASDGDPAPDPSHLAAVAAGGDVKAMLALARAYEAGAGVVRNSADSLHWYRAAADHGDPAAAAKTAALLLAGVRDESGAAPDALFPHGRGVAPDPAAARVYALRAAAAGERDGQALAGYLLASGTGGPADIRQAEIYYRPAAEAGHIEAALGLGTLIAGGHLGPPDPVAAKPWFAIAAAAGNATAEVSLGTILEGEGKRDEAIGWYDKAAGKGHVGAMRRLGAALLASGDAAAVVKGETWLRAAAARNDRDAFVRLADFIDPRDPFEASGWWQKAAEAGDPRAQRVLAGRLRQGLGLPVDMEKARGWLIKAAGSGDVAAQFELSVVYAVGQGVERDMATAVKWSEAAAARGHNIARVNLARYRMQGLGGDRDPIAALKLLQAALEAGEKAALLALGELFAFWYTPPDKDRARMLFVAAANAGDPRAAEMMARLDKAG